MRTLSISSNDTPVLYFETAQPSVYYRYKITCNNAPPDAVSAFSTGVVVAQGGFSEVDAEGVGAGAGSAGPVGAYTAPILPTATGVFLNVTLPIPPDIEYVYAGTDGTGQSVRCNPDLDFSVYLYPTNGPGKGPWVGYFNVGAANWMNITVSAHGVGVTTFSTWAEAPLRIPSGLPLKK